MEESKTDKSLGKGGGMKVMKAYEKPRISIEQFTLSHHVADCGWELQAGDEESCYAEPDPDWNLGVPDGTRLFLGGPCNFEPESYCYTDATGAYSLFRS